MFTNRLFYSLVVIALLVVTACAPEGQTPEASPISPTSDIPSPTEAATAIVVPSATEPFKVVQDALLPPGTYTSEVFQPPLTYTVPAGWVMYDDEPGQFELALENKDPYIYVWRDIRAVAPNCAQEVNPDVGSSAVDIAGWLATRDGLDTSEPQPVNIGGLSGYVIDVRQSPDWVEACPFSDGQPTVPTIMGTSPLSGQVFWGTLIDDSQRYYFLDLGEDGVNGNIVITAEVCCGAEWDEVIKTVSPVIDSFVFAP
jgi:hypothetical protein